MTLSLRESYAQARATVLRSGTSFGAGMRILPKPRRDAMFALYAFCREVDDIADEPGALSEKLRALDAWRREVDGLGAGVHKTAIGPALSDAAARYGVPKSELHAMIDGMETDARGGLHAPDLAELKLYCRRVAGSVGLMSVRIFGAPDEPARRFALALADAFQMTNILRDVMEDAERDRLYLPRVSLEAAGIDPTTPAKKIAEDARLNKAKRHLAENAAAAWDQAGALLEARGAQGLKPALLMAAVYRLYFDAGEASGWRGDAAPVGSNAKLATAAKAFFGRVRLRVGGARAT